jgi:hypothetical protein
MRLGARCALNPQSTPTTKRRRLRVWGMALGALAALVLLALAAPRWLRNATPAANEVELAALSQRCQAEMLRGTCSAMNTSAPTSGASRLFIAGVGEVDAAAFAALRAAGNEMCGDAAKACRADWNGNTCRVTRALYPVPPQAETAATAASSSK